MTAKPFSIKKRLILSILTVLIIFLTIAITMAYLFARHEIEEVYDAHLSQSAKMLESFMNNLSDDTITHQEHALYQAWFDAMVTARQPEKKAFTTGHPYEQNFIFQIYQNGKLIWQSNTSQLPIHHIPNFQGFADIIVNHTNWRVFQLPVTDNQLDDSNTNQSYILVAENSEIRNEITNEIALSSALPLMLLIPILLILIILLIDNNLQPLNTLRIAISQRHANKLDHIYLANPPTELTSLVSTLNQLLTELEHAREREKRFTLMAAHELKTPLTILRLNAQNAMTYQDQYERLDAFKNILEGIDRTDRLIQQLLTFAKLEQLKYIDKKEIDLASVIKNEIASLAPFAIKQNQEISFEGEPINFNADELLIPLLFRNLIDNAIRYSGFGSTITIKLFFDDSSITIIVSDTGETIPDEVKLRLFENFYRGHAENGQGAGLGMSIIKEIVTLHDGSISINNFEDEHGKLGNHFKVMFNR
ncbi:sensor histidine kinase [Thorsellia anophelis]|uniref:histidine kinase n=1 Tax=Thorsellia anophelis DSM 18579 TaxID=1123402 RepID=A0A1I0EYK6_9GAMM|nr:ATP-binding protein [Thorsellia anophelis]SET50435.1 two-component system, OmpR family, sensor histidine kinase QseC [Thorsellia anophelis DSM 18579]